MQCQACGFYRSDDCPDCEDHRQSTAAEMARFHSIPHAQARRYADLNAERQRAREWRRRKYMVPLDGLVDEPSVPDSQIGDAKAAELKEAILQVGGELAQTLDALEQCGGNVAEVVRSMRLNRKTIEKRRELGESLLRRFLD